MYVKITAILAFVILTSTCTKAKFTGGSKNKSPNEGSTATGSDTATAGTANESTGGTASDSNGGDNSSSGDASSGNANGDNSGGNDDDGNGSASATAGSSNGSSNGSNTGASNGSSTGATTGGSTGATTGTTTGTATGVTTGETKGGEIKVNDCKEKEYVEPNWPKSIQDCVNSGLLYDFNLKKCSNIPKATFTCDWAGARQAEVRVMGSDPGEGNRIGTKNRTDDSKIVGCGEFKDDRYHILILQYWTPTVTELENCEFKEEWLIHTSCRVKRTNESDDPLTWEECLTYP